MQVKTTAKAIGEVKHEYVRVVFAAKGAEKLVHKEGVTELHIHAGRLEKVTSRTLRTLVREIVMSAKKHKLAKVAMEFDVTKL